MGNSEHGSVTLWLSRLREGDAKAAEALWQRYFDRLVAHARRRRTGVRAGIADEEDAALSAFACLCDAVRVGRYPKLNDRSDLWRLLIVLTSNKALSHRRREGALKRGGGRTRDEAAMETPHEAGGAGLDGFAGPDPTPDFVACMTEEIDRLFDQLDEDLRNVALRKMDGWSNGEIAKEMNLTERSIERKLGRIRKRWREASPEELG